MQAVVWDTEYTTWNGAMARDWSGDGECRELVQLAARKIDFNGGDTLDEINIFVRPVRNPELSECFTGLTHITQDQIERDGIAFAEAYEAFKKFAGTLPCFSYGTDAVILQEGCDLNGINYDLRCLFLDARIYFKNNGIDVRNYTSGTIAQAFGIRLDGHVHNALHDVDSLSQALLALHNNKKIKVA
ncbi:MAG: hypothetical protein EA357_11725 [Micavibrio sp.]|nr:MAG: hypothetical protein EA357_11725 [Micavibrio sp.]